MGDDFYFTTDVDEEELIYPAQVRAFENYRTKLSNDVEPHFKHILENLKTLDEEDKDMIEYTEQKRGVTAGIFEMLDLLVTKDNFWDDLVQSLNQLSLTDLSSGLHKGLENEKMSDVEYKQKYDEYIETNDDTLVKRLAGTTGINRTEVKARRLIPRKYQTELAEKAIEGDNCLICAPTGSGKTFVSIMITQRHLAKYQEPSVDGAAENCAGKGCVLFLVPRFALLQQIYRQYKELLPMYSVGKKSGSSPSRIKLAALISNNDVVVITDAILKNALKEGSVKFTDFTLLVFDECHHANKYHNTNKIMEMYIRKKDEVALPQIVGLTASPGAGQSVSATAAREWILKLCANLDSSQFVTVKEHEKELNDVASVPSRTPIMSGERAPNPFVNRICQYMQFLEDEIGLSTVPERGSQIYESYIMEAKNRFISYNSKEKEICCEHLVKINEALELTALVWMQDGYALLKEWYNKVFLSHSHLMEIERKIMPPFTELLLSFIEDEKLNENMELMKRIVVSRKSYCSDDDYQKFKGFMMNLKMDPKLDEEYPNPKLGEVKRVIIAAKRDCDKSDFKEFRAMVYAKTRLATLSVFNWLNRDPDLAQFNAQYLTGVSASGETGGMTSEETKSKLEKFDKGEVKILVCTTVGEEGLNIPACRLVIRYNHVTNEISMIQARGRIREKEGNEVIIGDSDVLAKDKTNILLEEVMQVAMKNIMELEHHVFMDYIKEYQEEAMIMTKLKEKQSLEAKISSPYDCPDVKLLCRKCDKFACNLSDIRRLNNSNYVNKNPEFQSKVDFREHDKPLRRQAGIQKIHCIECGCDWGNTARTLPCLKISSFTLEINGMRKQVKQWSKVAYNVPKLC